MKRTILTVLAFLFAILTVSALPVFADVATTEEICNLPESVPVSATPNNIPYFFRVQLPSNGLQVATGESAPGPRGSGITLPTVRIGDRFNLYGMITGENEVVVWAFIPRYTNNVENSARSAIRTMFGRGVVDSYQFAPATIEGLQSLGFDCD